MVMKMSEILLSICISSYNRGSKCVRLVEKILTVEDDRYNIFICDDCSNKDTIEKLKNLRSSKVFLIQNKKNVINYYMKIIRVENKSLRLSKREVVKKKKN